MLLEGRVEVLLWFFAMTLICGGEILGEVNSSLFLFSFSGLMRRARLAFLRTLFSIR